MGQRPTRRAGLAKFRLPDPQLQKTLDAIVERIEVLDGIRGDSLDKAVTYRDLGESGFTIIPGAGGTNQIINTPGSGTGNIEPGPTGRPSNLAANETFLALLLTWTNPGANLQHIEVWRADADNLSTALLIGTTVSPQFVDYVGANATYYYWVRAVGTDGTLSAYNDTAGTEGTTGIDPSQISIPGGGFEIQDPGVGPDIAPFIVGTINGETAVGLQGQFIVDGTIRALSIVADSIGAREIFVTSLEAIESNMGTLTAGLIRTADQTPDGYRVELQDQASTGYPLWYGFGGKSNINGKFYVDQNGNVVIKGRLSAGMIEQTYFSPSVGNNAFRIATEWPNHYVAGEYSGKKAHLFPMQVTNFHSSDTNGLKFAPTPGYPGEWFSDPVIFVGPAGTGDVEYGRLGTNSELLMIWFSVMMLRTSGGGDGNGLCWLTLQFQYNTDGWSEAYTSSFRMGSSSAGSGRANQAGLSMAQIFATQTTPFDTIKFRVKVRLDNTEIGRSHCWMRNCSLLVMSPNFGYADASVELQTPGGPAIPVEELPGIPVWDDGTHPP